MATLGQSSESTIPCPPSTEPQDEKNHEDGPEPPDSGKSTLCRSSSHTSHPDASGSSTPPAEQYREVGDDIYDRLSPGRKHIIVAILSFCAFLSPLSSTSVLAAIPEVAAEFHTTGSVIDASNAAYTALMGVSPIVWGPMSQVFGRRPVILLTAILFFLLSLATALSPDLAAFFVFRALSAFEGTSFILLGAACLGDIYRPTERGTALGWFMSGTLIGPAFGPFIGGIIVTRSAWRTIFWLQTACAGASVFAVFFLVPETIHHKKLEDLAGYSRKQKTRAILAMLNPIRVISLFRYWNQVFVAVSSAAMLWNMYSLLTPVRYVLNPRFHLQTPMQSGFFYLAPGAGYVLGTFGGGRWADMTVRRWIKKRNGERIPEDRLRSSLPFIGIIMPGCILIYGWAVDKAVGGIPLPVIALFIQGVGQLFAFASLNTYCLDVMPGRGADVSAANYFVRYLSGCVATAVVLPAVEGIGVGWFETLTAIMVSASSLGIMATIKWGRGWREKREGIDARKALVHAGEKESKAKAEPDLSKSDRKLEKNEGSPSDEKGEALAKDSA